jgi:hypothetical protein
MLVTGCLSEWLQGEVLSAPPKSNNHLQNWALKLQVLKTCIQLTYFQRLCPVTSSAGVTPLTGAATSKLYNF